MENLLKYGAIGLMLALSILVYKLVSSLLKKDSSNVSLKPLFLFMGFTIVVMIIGIAADQLKKSSTISTPLPSNYSWKRYGDDNGFSIYIPTIFEEITNWKRGVFSFKTNLDDKVTLVIDCTQSKEETTSDLLQKYYTDKQNENKSVIYKFWKSNNYFVVTGDKDGALKYYFKGLLKGKSYYKLNIEYPYSFEPVLDEVISKISLSFK